jgi:glycosyltransferase involved in cell wall biosynthesis
MISCVTITQPGRNRLLAEAVADFSAQTFADRELLIVHDGEAAFGADVNAIVTQFSSRAAATIRVISASNTPRFSLGELRNIATREAAGDWICQWDDDDRYHPERLELQWNAAQSQGAAFCFLVDQLHWFEATSELFWEDWQAETYPLNFVQGSLLARRDWLPSYPALTRGEDTPVCWQIARGAENGDYTIARLRGAGWSYVYRHHGGNAWDEAHHRAISTARSMSPARLHGALYSLQTRLAEYQPRLPALNMQVGSMVAGFKGGL